MYNNMNLKSNETPIKNEHKTFSVTSKDRQISPQQKVKTNNNKN